jgi:hypothetical protein
VAVDGSVEVAERSVDELRRLAETAGAEVVDAMVQRRPRPDASTFIGKGKARELAAAVKALGADTVVMDDELSPGQLRHLEELVDAKVIDRTALILDIFAQHATSREGKSQVELAQLNYLLPRLRGWGESLTRLGAGIGTRGPGETKMEVDRRRIRRRITRLRRNLADMARTRDVKRRSRDRAGVPGVWSRTSCSRPSIPPPAALTCRAGGPRPSPTPSASSPSCPTTWSRRSSRRWRRSHGPTWWCTWSTPPSPTPTARSPPCARRSPRSAPPTCPRCWCSTRWTCSTR